MFNVSSVYVTNYRGYPGYSDKDKAAFIKDLKKYDIRISNITNDLNNFASFIGFLTSKPEQAPYKLGIYIKDIMHFDASKDNDKTYQPLITYLRKSGDCDDAAMLCIDTLVSAGYSRSVERGIIPLPARMSDGSVMTNLDPGSYSFPLLVATSTNSVNDPITKSDFHAICVYSEPRTGLLNILETRKGLTLLKSKNLLELVNKFEPAWKRTVIFPIKDGMVDISKPYILIESPDLKPVK